MRLNKTELTLEIGETATLTADISPDPSLIKSIIFSASPEGIVTVDNNGNITAVSQGTAVVSATAGGTTATCTVTVNAVSTVDVAGKSFVLDDIVVDGWSDALIEQTKRQVAGTTFTFSDDDSVSIVWRSFVETGTYTQDGTDVTIHITDAVLGGTPQDIGDGFTVNVTLDGDKLLSPVFNEKGENIGYQIYVIKTEE
ncbi:MAG: Ig-like domain-containing protein [Clostridia bacterium]|nr:Ig-like domain-containing protein [Clostridia bacterium]